MLYRVIYVSCRKGFNPINQQEQIKICIDGMALTWRDIMHWLISVSQSVRKQMNSNNE